MKIKVNGQEQILLKSDMLVADILLTNNVTAPEMVSVQLNGKFLKKELYAETVVQENDEIDFLYFMGGGNVII